MLECKYGGSKSCYPFMSNTILAILLVGLLSIMGYLWLNPPNIAKSKLPPVVSDTLGIANTNIFNTAKDSFEQNSQKAVDGAKDTAYTEAQSVLEKIFGRESSSEQTANKVTIVEATDAKGKELYNIDLSTTANLKLKLLKNTDYYLKFQNTPVNYCLYINDSKYPIEEGKTVKLMFTSSGTYSLKANSCSLNDRIVGEFIVQ